MRRTPALGMAPPCPYTSCRWYNFGVKLPRICLVKQNLPDRSIHDIPTETREQLELADFASRVRPGARVAVGAGSRGIASIATVVRAVVDYWKEHGARPFIFPAMGSHGGATAEGQASVLAHYGIAEESMGCPIVSSLEVVSTGRTPEGIETFMDRQAYQSDGVLMVNRVKWHTDFGGKIESGLCKMSAIGVGKLAGAQQYHAFGHRIGLERVVRSVYRQVAQSGKLLGGLAILEDGNHAVAKLEAVHADRLEQREEELLELVKSWMARVPVETLDLLIVDQMGKDISGTGMDTKVVNRSIHGSSNCFDTAPFIHRVFAREMSDLSYGNAVGVGMADVVADRLLAKIDWDATYLNSLTACTPPGIQTPIHFPTDRECATKIGRTAGRLDLGEVTIAWIANTNALGRMALSESLLGEIGKNPHLEVLSEPMELPFDADGNLPPLGKVWPRP
jgi:hypothetical protein